MWDWLYENKKTKLINTLKSLHKRGQIEFLSGGYYEPILPIIPEEERSHVLAALECVDFVVLFGEDTPLELIDIVKPDILVKGADYTKEEVVGHEIVESYGGEVRLIPVVGSLSTSAIIDRIRNGERQ